MIISKNKGKRYNDLNTYFKDLYKCRVQKITLDAGMTCPNRDGSISKKGCIFCNAKGSGTGAKARGLSITEQIMIGKAALFKRYGAEKFLGYFQAFTNTYAHVEFLEKIYREALADDDVVGLSIGTRPDAVDKEKLDLLEELAREKLIWIEYGLQSSNNKTLEYINRGHDVQCYEDAVRKTQNRGIKICTHVILGLPGETREHMLNTARFIASQGIEGVKIHLLYIIKGTPLEHIYKKGDYECLDQWEYIDLVCDFLELLPDDMVIQRLTGDPLKHELIAPAWALRKAQILLMIKKTLEERNSFQGKFF